MNKRSEHIAQLQAIAQNGLAFAENPFDRERYEQLMLLTAEIAEEHTGVGKQEILDIFSEKSRYKTPSMDVRAAVFQDEKILLVQESNDLWAMPGGWCEVNISPKDNAEKEVLEETGLVVKGIKLIALYDKLKQDHPPQWPHAYKSFFLCELVGGKLIESNDEIQAVKFFSLDALPPLCIDRTTQQQIKRCFVHKDEPSLPTEFD